MPRFLLTWTFNVDMHIDHIFPLSCFDMHNSEEQKKATHFSNLQMLPASANLSKHAKLPTKAMAARVERSAWPATVNEAMLPDIYSGWKTSLQMQ